MAAEARFAIRERDDLKHRLRRANDLCDQYLKTIQELREEIEILKKALEEWRNAAPGEMET